MIKTILYTICKNEETRIENWLKCYKDVDEIVVLDTGSADKSVELLKKDPRVHLIKKTWDLFNFGEARNIALEEARKLTDKEPEVNWIFLCFDFDEILEDEGIKRLKKEWAQDTYENAIIYFTSPDNEGKPAPHYSRIHNKNKNWIWKGPIHEGIHLEKATGSEKSLWSKVTYYHNSDDPRKKQDFYEYLIKEWSQKLPENIHLKNYLIDIYLSHNETENCLKICNELINLTKDKFDKLECYLSYFHALYIKSKLIPEEELKDLLALDKLAESYRDGRYVSRRIKLSLGIYYLSKAKNISLNRELGKNYLNTVLNMNNNPNYYYPFEDIAPTSKQQIRELLHSLEGIQCVK